VHALDAAAAAVSTAPDVEGVLAAVVDAAKRFTGSEKVVFCLRSSAPPEAWLEHPEFVVRGSRSEHCEEWWAPEVPDIASTALATRAPCVRTLPDASAWILAVPVVSSDERLGVLLAINSLGHELTGEHTAFLSMLAAVAAASVVNARLAEQARYALLASERERIAREMHDGIAQSLFSISLGIDVCRRSVQRDPALVARRLEEIESQLRESMAEVRRYIYDLRPAKLRELGLQDSLRYWVQQSIGSGGPAVEFASRDGQGGLPSPIEACLYHVGREAISNAIRHSGASRITVELETDRSTASLTVSDDGCGFDPDAPGASAAGTHGLRTMTERVQALGGTFAIDTAPGRGCRVHARVPIASEEA
jgi:signal transduction histidine kinase